MFACLKHFILALNCERTWCMVYEYDFEFLLVYIYSDMEPESLILNIIVIHHTSCFLFLSMAYKPLAASIFSHKVCQRHLEFGELYSASWILPISNFNIFIVMKMTRGLPPKDNNSLFSHRSWSFTCLQECTRHSSTIQWEDWEVSMHKTTSISQLLWTKRPRCCFFVRFLSLSLSLSCFMWWTHILCALSILCLRKILPADNSRNSKQKCNWYISITYRCYIAWI